MNLCKSVIESIVEVHAENAAFDWLLRRDAVAAPNYDLQDLAELDHKVDANLDGLAVAGASGMKIAMENALRHREPGECFAATWMAVVMADGHALDEMVALTENNPGLLEPMTSALGWLDLPVAEPVLSRLMRASSIVYQRLALGGYALHRQVPEAWLTSCVVNAKELLLLPRALKAVGETGRLDLLPALASYFNSRNPEVRFWAAWSAARLGDNQATARLEAFVQESSPYNQLAIQMILCRLPPQDTFPWLRTLSRNKSLRRLVLQGMGLSGNPLLIPVLIEQMGDPQVARVAGEAFSMITGTDLSYEDLDTETPEGVETGPSDEAGDDDVTLDQDESLPWPHQERVQQWWECRRDFFIHTERYLCGKPVSEEQCHHVLRTGFQRQRAAAALELSLMNPSQPIFEVRMPGFRQKRLLGV